jgi:hypothetical protein
MPRRRQNDAYQRFGATNRRLRAPLARDEAICRCPSQSERAILASNPQESGECRFKDCQRITALISLVQRAARSSNDIKAFYYRAYYASGR